MTLPVFGVVTSRFVLQPSQTELWREIEGDHIDILQHIVASDGAAAEAMRTSISSGSTPSTEQGTGTALKTRPVQRRMPRLRPTDSSVQVNAFLGPTALPPLRSATRGAVDTIEDDLRNAMR